MKLITRDTGYAIMALIFIARRKNKIVSVSELVRHLKIPKPFLRKILQTLNRKGLLHSHKGKGGGFVLSTSPDKILLIDLIQIFQGEIRLNECIFRKRICPKIKTCKLKRRIDSIQDYVISKLEDISLAYLMKGF